MLEILRRRAWDLRALWFKRHRVVFFADRRGWVLDRVARELAENLPPECKPGISAGPDLHFLRCRVVHFLGHFDIFGEAGTRNIHPSNSLVATWWHGTAQSSDAVIREAFARVAPMSSRLDRITVTCSMYESALQAAGVPRAKLLRLALGVDTRRFQPASEATRANARRRLGIPRDAFCIGSFQKDGIGWDQGLEPKLIKGPDVLCDAIGKLAGRKVVVLLSGPARGYTAGRLQRASITVVQAGFVPLSEMPALYHAIDAYVISSREEGGPVALLEAMASGVPVISTRVGMPADLISDGRNGFLVNVEDAGRLAAGVIRLMDDDTLRRRIAAEALATAAAFDWKSVALQYYEKLYRPLMRRASLIGETR